jgi:hypothetical protein
MDTDTDSDSDTISCGGSRLIRSLMLTEDPQKEYTTGRERPLIWTGRR